MKHQLVLGLLVIGIVISGCTPIPGGTDFTTSFKPVDAFEQNKQLGRGVNMGNMLEAPTEGEWGLTLKEEFIEQAHKAGFNSIRVPIRWSAHAAADAPYTIDPEFFKRIDDVIAQVLSRDMLVMINIHHYDELITNTDAHRPRFLAIWKQIAERYKSYDAKVLFEVLNEPHDIGDSTWNGLMNDAITAIRASNPTRNIVVGPLDYYAIRRLPDLELPDDQHLIATIHYYLPFQFTHQGAEWVAGSASWLGTKWDGKSGRKQEITFDFDRAVEWAKEHNRPLNLGEFGAYSKADIDSRALWTDFVARQAERRNMSWDYWEFGAGFGVYDPAAKTWNEPIRDALLPKK